MFPLLGVLTLSLTHMGSMNTANVSLLTPGVLLPRTACGVAYRQVRVIDTSTSAHAHGETDTEETEEIDNQ